MLVCRGMPPGCASHLVGYGLSCRHGRPRDGQRHATLLKEHSLAKRTLPCQKNTALPNERSRAKRTRPC
eukprot:271990-Chlamydomonas_euryale.AAC.1